MRRVVLTSALSGVFVLGAVVACDDVAAPGTEPISLTFAAPAAAFNAGGGALHVSATDGARCVTVSRADFQFSRIDFERADVFDDVDTDLDTDGGLDSDRDTDTDDRDNLRLAGPITVRLDFDEQGRAVIRERLPLGTFDEIEFRVDRIRLVGTVMQRVNGACVLTTAEPFDVTVRVNEKFELHFDEPLVIEETNDEINVTVLVNPAEWLVINGRVIDPRLLETDARLRQRFRARLRAAIRAFEDRNGNGQDDRDTDSD